MQACRQKQYERMVQKYRDSTDSKKRVGFIRFLKFRIISEKNILFIYADKEYIDRHFLF